VAVTQSGRWLPADASAALLAHQPVLTSSHAKSVPTAGDGVALVPLDNQLPTVSAGLRGIDVVIPLIHGTSGEDGTLQGVLEFAGIPYVGAGVAASAVGMDKHLQKLVLRAAGLPVLDWVLIEKHRWLAQRAACEQQVVAAIGFPCFIKPANMGSSVGVHKVHAADALGAAIDDASQYDTRILAEVAASNPREIEVSVLGNHEPIASVPGEILPTREFYDYAAKYLDPSSGLAIPAHLTDEQASAVRRLALLAFTTLGCDGMARVDSFLCGEQWWVNELNTIPGFTRISMYPKLWEASGISYSELLDRLIALATERHTERQGLFTRYQPPSA
jgi:D-alanine-D-alanine ligase